MNAFEPIGYLASLLVLATFCMRDMVALRLLAITSNVAFIAYGALADIYPVLLLHVVLLPVNVLRIAESWTRSLPRSAGTEPLHPARRVTRRRHRRATATVRSRVRNRCSVRRLTFASRWQADQSSPGHTPPVKDAPSAECPHRTQAPAQGSCPLRATCAQPCDPSVR